MDDDGMESFDINETDLEYALNPGRRRFQTKEDAIYGSFKGRDVDSDEEYDYSNKKGPRQRKNYSGPISFVSGGVKVGSSVEPSALKVQEEEVIEEVIVRREPKPAKSAGSNVFAGMRTAANSGTGLTEESADWMKKSGKGSVIMKLMKNMGYIEGKGLGKAKEGIVEPIQAAVRKGRAAVGAYGQEVPGPRYGEKKSRDIEEEVAETSRPVAARGAWKKSAAVKTRYKTIDEVLSEDVSFKTKALPSVKVIDMTGPEQRVYSGYESFSMKSKSEIDEVDREVFDVPELRHNINLLLDLTEDAIRRNDTQVKSLKDQNTALQYDLKQINQTMIDEEQELDRMKSVYEIAAKFSNKKLSMNECQEIFLELRSDYPEEYKMFNLEMVAIPSVLPLIKEYFSSWDPLNPDHLIKGIDLMKEWNNILKSDSKSIFKHNSYENMCAYDRLLWEGWMPILRRAVLRWDPRGEVEIMIALIETWLPVLPGWMQENVLDQLIIPRIGERVNEWDPCTDIIPIHTWLVPWLSILGDRLQPVLSPVRQKLAKALRAWDPVDTSALSMIKPWVNVWAPATMSTFLSQSIVPKLEKCLNDMDLDPSRDRREKPEWDAVMAWIELINADIIANALTRYFFPRWYQILLRWMNAPGADVNEIKEWFLRWHNRISSKFSDQPVIKNSLRCGMEALSNYIAGRPVSLPAMQPTMNQIPLPEIPIKMPPRQMTQQITLREAVEMTAQRHGLTYVPQRDRFREGRQVFWFGPLSVFIDGGAVFVYDPQSFTWRVCSMDELLQMATTSS